MLAKPDGRYRPAEVRVGDSAGGQTEILAGLAAGEKVVASGQFLIDSEASLSGVEARPISEAPKTAGPSTAQSAGAYSTTGTIEAIEPKSIKLAHEAVDALGWPAMTMAFRLGDRSMLRGFKRGDHVRFSFDQTKAGPTLRTITREGAQ
jgi:Cu(I)/Ag(I) efflux system membrane fusion protein